MTLSHAALTERTIGAVIEGRQQHRLLPGFLESVYEMALNLDKTTLEPTRGTISHGRPTGVSALRCEIGC